jgi:DNA-binding XRE family transcriptional regulator
MSPDEYRKHREQLGLTQAGLAALLGIPRTAVVKRESGVQRISEEASIALRSLPRPKTGRVRKAP